MSYLVRVIAMASDILTIYYALYRNYRIKIRDILFVEETKRHRNTTIFQPIILFEFVSSTHRHVKFKSNMSDDISLCTKHEWWYVFLYQAWVDKFVYIYQICVVICVYTFNFVTFLVVILFYGPLHVLVDLYEYPCHKWQRICYICRIHFPVLSPFMTYHRLCN